LVVGQAITMEENKNPPMAGGILIDLVVGQAVNNGRE